MAELFYGYQPYSDERISFIYDPVSKRDTYFRNSEIKNFGEEVFGDKAVSHLVMRGTVDPYIHEGELPWPVDWNTSYQDSYYQCTGMCSTGVNSCTSASGVTGKPGRYGYYDWIATQRVHQVFAKEDGIYCRSWTRYMAEHSDVDAIDAGAILDPTEDTIIVELKILDWSGNLNAWPVSEGPWTTSVVYELFDTVPYDWKEWMRQIRPWNRQDDGALSEVIRNTIQDATSLNMNNYANAMQIVDLFRDFRNFNVGALIEDSKHFYKRCLKEFGKGNITGKRVRGAIHKGAKWAADGWLKYRYAYETTKSDIEEYIKKVVKPESQALEGLTPDRVLRGSIGIAGGTLRVKMRLHDDPFAGFDRMLINADRRGFMPGLYNLWDMIPFSFVADWFSGLGDKFQDIDQSLYFRYYKVDELLVTTKQTLTRDELWGLTDYKWYNRELLEEFPQWEIYEENSASGKVITYRALDIGSLCVGVL